MTWTLLPRSDGAHGSEERTMAETVAASASWVGEAIAPYLHDAAIVSVVLLLAAFWTLILQLILHD
jgi:hypothetical protein